MYLIIIVTIVVFIISYMRIFYNISKLFYFTNLNEIIFRPTNILCF